MKKLGIDIGSTTMKCVLLDESDRILYSSYQRHHSRIRETALEILEQISEQFPGESAEVSVSGSAGMGIAEETDLPFTQEVFAEQIAVKKLQPDTDAVIELGGEDAKILFLTDGFEMRMNGTCAGGTGAFIDQMVTLMKITPEELNDLSSRHKKICTIASRCGVFAKSDIQPLLNQGMPREDIAAGIFQAVVNQTVAGLAQGRKIKGKVLYLGGPLTYLSELRNRFDQTLNTVGICPENSLYYVAIGCACAGVGKEIPLADLCEVFRTAHSSGNYVHTVPLFRSEEEYEQFRDRHQKASEGVREIDRPADEMYLGIDAGSTTVKMVLCDREGNLFRPFYSSNNGNPIPLVQNYLEELYRDYPEIRIRAGAVTGYGEELIRNAFGVDFGLVETVAHYTAAKKFRPDVDFILDIGGQDIKCFQIRNGVIDNLYLNEACSSGCGSFLQAFAETLGYTPAEFSALGRFAKAPVDLGSRCTVFMNSAVKQAQKDGADLESIAAGLSVSVVKNALYKVIRCANPEQLGKNIVVQGGTLLNDCVLRAFEQETGREVVRPKYSALMGAYGAALYACENAGEKSSLLDAEALRNFTCSVSSVTCGGCTNHCELTVNSFGNGRKYISGNRCSKPLKQEKTDLPRDLYQYKTDLLQKCRENTIDPKKKTIGLPLGLNFYELLPFWHAFFRTLNFNVLVSPFSDRELYLSGQHTIPSDTVCYPAKLLHGHIEWLLKQKPDAIFYPDMTYNVDEGLGVNHYNCPVVAYYPQVLKGNTEELKQIPFICDFLSLADPKQFENRIRTVLAEYFPPFSKQEIRKASRAAYQAYREHLDDLRSKAQEYIRYAVQEQKPIIVLAGRPYHVDPEINHGIHSLITSLGAVVLTEDSLSHLEEPFPTGVRNQWTYHSRLYAAARYVAQAPEEQNIHLIQLVSFGCGVDAITSDETREILEKSGKIYTQIKIDEISNMGAVTIRLRSLFSVIDSKRRKRT